MSTAMISGNSCDVVVSTAMINVNSCDVVVSTAVIQCQQLLKTTVIIIISYQTLYVKHCFIGCCTSLNYDPVNRPNHDLS